MKVKFSFKKRLWNCRLPPAAIFFHPHVLIGPRHEELQAGPWKQARVNTAISVA